MLRREKGVESGPFFSSLLIQQFLKSQRFGNRNSNLQIVLKTNRRFVIVFDVLFENEIIDGNLREVVLPFIGIRR